MAKAKAAKQPGVWGIDLGQCAFKAIRLEMQGGEIQATAFDYIEHAKILSQPDADADQLTREALEKFLSRNDLKGDLIAIGVPGQSGLARFVKLPPVDPKKITDIVKFEAKQQIPFPLHEVVWGYQRLGPGTKSDNMILDAEIGLFAMKRDMINRTLQHFKEVGIEVHYIQMAPLALCNFLAHDLLGKGAAGEEGDENDEEKANEKTCVVGLDIGADNSNLVITDGEKIIWQRPIPLGGNHFTRALTKDLKLTFAKAEHLKRNAVKSPDLKKILAALKPVLNDFVSEVQRSLGYFTNTHRDATIKHMLGLGNAFRLPGLQKYLQEKLQLEVRKLQKIQRLAGDEEVTEAPQYVENVLSFGVAQGLALQGLQATRIHTNLLPPEIAQERVVRAKKPWVAAAAAVLLLISPPLLLGWAATKSAWDNPDVATATKKLKKIIDEGRKDVNDAKDKEDDAVKIRSEVDSLAGGVQTRLSWLHLYNFISEAVPRPDGTRMVEKARDGFQVRKNYFNARNDGKMSGSAAYERWKSIKDNTGPGSGLTDKDQLDEEEIKKSLVQVQIENVGAFWSDKLAVEFFRQIIVGSKYYTRLNGFKPEEQSNARKMGSLPGKGWIIEIRGYTYHHDQDAFVLNTLVENLVDLADPDLKDRRLKGVKLHPKAEEVLYQKDGNGTGFLSYFLLYDYKQVVDPKPGAFELINKSYGAVLTGVYGGRAPTGPAVQTAPPPTAGPEGGAPAAPAAPTLRNTWRPPVGTHIYTSFDPISQRVIGSTDPQPGQIDVTKKAVPRAPRTEFIVFFLWLQQ